MYTAIKAHHGMYQTGNAINYIANEEKTDLSKHQDRIQNEDPLLLDQHTLNLFDYSTNPNKTVILEENGEEAQLVSGYNCDPYMVKEEFQLCMDSYYQKGHHERLSYQMAKRVMRAKLDENGNPVRDPDGNLIYDENAPVYHDPKTGKCEFQRYKKMTQARTSYGWVVSCPPKEVCGFDIDPRIVHAIGLEWCERMFGSEYMALVATHCDRKHIHNHVSSCAYKISGDGKYRDTMENLTRARQIADDLSLKFGIPITAEPSLEQGTHIDWSEWASKEQGQSWKEQMRQDIAAVARVANSYPEFVELMKESGYGIRETEGHITYIMPGDENWRCRDNRLGKDFTKKELMKYYEELANANGHTPKERVEKTLDSVPAGRKKRNITIRVPRYTEKGRRRSDLEMVFLIAIKIIRAIRDLFQSPVLAKEQPYNPVYRDFTWREKQMLDSLKVAQSLGEEGINNKEDLDKLLDETGQRLSIAKKEESELKRNEEYSQKMINLIEEYNELADAVKAIGYENSLYLYDVTDKEIRDNIAKESPATPSQRRNMYMLLQKTDNHFRTAVGYDEISSAEAEAVIKYLQNKTDEKPAILLEGKEKEKLSLTHKYEKVLNTRMEKEKQKYSEPISDAQKKRVLSIINAQAPDIDNDRLKEYEDVQLDVDVLTKFDAMQIINFFTKEEVYTSRLINNEEKTKLNEMLGNEKASVNRPVEYITKKEYDQLTEYFKMLPDRRKYVKKPQILEPLEKPVESNINQLRELIKIRDVMITVPVEVMTKEDVYTLTNYLLKRNVVPECLNGTKDDRKKRSDLLFETSIVQYPEKDQQTIAMFRDISQNLKNFGISESFSENSEKIRHIEYDKAKENLRRLQKSQKEIEDLSNKYKNLSRLKYTLGLAQNERFTYGPEYNKEQEKVNVEENSKERDAEDQRIEKIERENRHKVTDPKAFTYTDRYFDQNYQSL